MIVPIIRKRQIRSFLTYDLEWIPGTLKLRVAGVYDGERYRCYSSIEAFIASELTSSNRGKWFYAHAGGLADLQFVLEKVIGSKKFQVKASFSGSSAIICHVKRGKNSWHFVDSYWLLRDRLANIAKWVGMKKGGPSWELDDEVVNAFSEKDFNEYQAKRREWYASVPLPELVSYNEGDCVILWNAIESFQVALLDMGGQLQMTLASSAMHLFRRQYLTGIIETDRYVNEQARLSYFASRVEVFERHISRANYYDINSSFPFSMTKPLPGNLIGSSSSLPDNDAGIYFADCEIKVPDGFITPAPLRLGGRVFFPVGSWRSWLTDVDIRLIEREGGKIQKVHETMIFEPNTDLRDYAIDLYEKRKNSENDFQKVVYKLLLNSLYGKFAESPYKSGLEVNPDNVNDETMSMLFPGVYLCEKKVPIPHEHVPISSYVTSLSRRALYDHIVTCRDVHYCDTDGFSTSDTLSTGKNLGELKLEKTIDSERDESEGAYFLASKVYRMVGKDDTGKSIEYNKAKGFSRMTSERWFKLAENESIEFERMARLKEIYRQGRLTPKESIYVKRIRKSNLFAEDFDSNTHAIPKRFTYPDGTTRPWHIDELRSVFR